MKSRFAILLLIGLACCKSKTDTVLPPVKLIVNVVDTSNNPLTTNVPVYLFDNINAYNAASAYFSGSGAAYTDTTANGQCTFTGIPTTPNYYVYSHYKNYSGLRNGYYYDYDNSDNYTIDHSAFAVTPVAGTTPEVTAKIVMKPVDGLVTFWTSDANKNVLPIKLTIDNQYVTTIDSTFSITPSYDVSGAFTQLLKSGVEHSYSATSLNCSGCTWEVSNWRIKPGEVTPLEIPACSTGTAKFWTDASNNSALPIDIIGSDSTTIIATIVNATSSEPDLASINPQAKRVDDPKTYYYTAKSRTNKNCVWEVSYTITAGQCTPIYIPKCEN